MNKNDLITLKIENLGNEGEGIGRVDGLPLFVKGAIPGDEIIARVLKDKKSYAFGKIEEIISPSPDRVEPKCPVAGRCGGCQIQHLSYEKQLEMKAQKVFDCLNRLGGIEAEKLLSVREDVIGMDEPWYYRNKAQYPFGLSKDGGVQLGFYAYHSHNIIENDECMIENPVCSTILKLIRSAVIKYKVAVYDEEKHQGIMRHCLIRSGKATGEVMVCLVLNAGAKQVKRDFSEDSPFMQELIKGLREQVPGFVSLCINTNTEKTNVILGKDLYPVYGPLYITDKIGDVAFHISPLSFYQVNPVQTKKLYDKALEYAGLTGVEYVWDLYCGTGTISLFLAQKAAKVIGVEIVPAAIVNAKENAALNGFTNTEFYVGAAEDVAPTLVKKFNPDVICVDPPRKGCDETLLALLLKLAPQRIVYVSCDPATLGRDVKILTQGGYELTKYCPVDQFCHSGHVETVCLLSKIH